MPPLTLGASPAKMSVILTKDAAFYQELENADGAFTAGAVIDLRIGASTWVATIAGAVATFNIDKATVNTVITAAPKTAKLHYTDGSADLVWAIGAVVIHA